MMIMRIRIMIKMMIMKTVLLVRGGRASGLMIIMRTKIMIMIMRIMMIILRMLAMMMMMMMMEVLLPKQNKNVCYG